MNADYRDLLAAFRAAEVKFLVVGAHALAVHGVPRMTQDLDVWIEPTAENARKTWTALAEFGAPLDTLAISESDFTKLNVVVQFGLPPSRIDVMTSISGVGFDDAWAGRTEVAMFGVAVPVIGRDAFIRNKRASARPKDLLDVEALGE